MSDKAYDAVVVGAGPNGLAASIALLQAGKSVALLEAHEQIGGGARSAQLTLPGFTHDLCSAVFPLGIGSPFFRSLPLARYGLEWIQPPAPLAHPSDDGSAALLERSVELTAENLGGDAAVYRQMMDPLVRGWEGLDADILGPLRRPRHLARLIDFGLKAIRPAKRLASSRFRTERARALFGGLAAHSMLPLEEWVSSAFGLVLAVSGHAVGWPIVRGGSQRLADALAALVRSLGGEIFSGQTVRTLNELPKSRVVLCDVTPRQLLAIAGERLSASYRRSLGRFRYGMGAFKIDWALAEPVPWKAKECSRAATVHLGGGLSEIALSERAAWNGEHAERPFVLAVQPSLFDSSRAPSSRHTLWAYCHVPNGSQFDMTGRIEAQIERFAPGFRDTVLARCVAPPAELERRNANLVGGDINGGSATLGQLFFRPTYRMYGTSAPGLYLCSASTPPGGGVHGMCGYFAARQALKEIF